MRFTIGRTRLLGVLAVGLALGAGVTQAQQQSGTISGTVTDRISNAPLSSVRVSALGTNRSVLTNQQGRYTLAGVPAGTYQVQAAIIGYGAATNTAAVVAGQSETVDFGLRPAAVSLDAVTVTTPAGEQRARESGNATINIDLPKQIENQSTATLADALSGKGVGVQVLQSGGTVGTGTRIRIRGQTSLSLSNEPVYYVDGVRVESGDVSLSVGTGGQAPSRINDINPQDIANVEVVKGPAASTLYGTQAANGVIRITTKRGVAGPARNGEMAEAPERAQALEAGIGHPGPPEVEDPQAREADDEWHRLVPHSPRPQVEQLESAQMAKRSQGGLRGGTAPEDQGLQVQRAKAFEGGRVGPGLPGLELELVARRHPNVAAGLAELPPTGAPPVAGGARSPAPARAAQRQRPERVFRREIKLPARKGQGSKGTAGVRRINGLPPGAIARIHDHAAKFGARTLRAHPPVGGCFHDKTIKNY